MLQTLLAIALLSVHLGPHPKGAITAWTVVPCPEGRDQGETQDSLTVVQVGPRVGVRVPKAKELCWTSAFTLEAGLRGYLMLGAWPSGVFRVDDRELPSPPPGRSWFGELAAPVDLEPGEHRVTVRTKTRRGRASVLLRLVGRDSRPLDRGVSVTANGPGLEEALAAYLPVKLERPEVTMTPWGFSLEVPVTYGAGIDPTVVPTVTATIDGERVAAGKGGHGLDLHLDRSAPPPGRRDRPGAGATDDSPGAGSGRPSSPLAMGASTNPSDAGPTVEEASGDVSRITLQAVVGREPVSRELTLELPYVPREHRALFEASTLLALAEANTTVPRTSVDAVEVLLREAKALVEAGDRDTAYRARLVDLVVEQSRALAAGRDPFAGRTGPMVRAYRSDVDGRLQPYALYVPPGYSRTRAYPLVVGLHGMHSTPRLCLRRLFGFDLEEGEDREHGDRHMPALPRVPALVVCPWGFGDVGFRFMGERDVLEVVAQVSELYRVDPRRVTITGPSMGGIATFALAMRYPSTFAGAAALCGQADVRQYREIHGFPMAPWEELIAARQSPVDWAVNGKYLPFLVVHGTRDPTPVSHSRVFVDEYQRLGYDATLETPPLGHNVWGETYAQHRTIDMLRRRRRPRRPGRVVFTTWDYRHLTSDWVTIERRESSLGRATVEGSAYRSRVRVQTDGVLGLTLHLGAPGFPRRGRLRVWLDGQRFGVRAGRDVTFTRPPGGRWSQRRHGGDGRPTKHAGLSGPMDDVLYDPMLLVYGTRDPTQVEVNEFRAREDARSLWGARVSLPVKADVEVTRKDMEARHLILYGGPDSNLVAHELARELPIEVGPDHVEVGGRVYRGADVGVAFVYPNPRARARYVLIKAGTTWIGTYYSRYLPRYLPDYVVFDQRVVGPRHRRILQGRCVLDGGMFDEAWRLPRSGDMVGRCPAAGR